MTLGLINANPVVHAKKERIARTEDLHCDDAVDPLEIYDILYLRYCFSFVDFNYSRPSSVINIFSDFYFCWFFFYSESKGGKK